MTSFPDSPSDKETLVEDKKAQAEIRAQSGREAMAEYRDREAAATDNASRLKALRLARDAEVAGTTLPPKPPDPTLDEIRRTVGALGDDPPTLLAYLRQIVLGFPEIYAELLSEVRIKGIPRSELSALILKAAEDWAPDLPRGHTGQEHL